MTGAAPAAAPAGAAATTAAARTASELVVAHHHPGRLRLRSHAFERDPALGSALVRWLREQPGVRRVRSNAATGAVLVTYDLSLTNAGALLEAIAGRSRLAVAGPEAKPHEPPVQTVFDAASALDRRVLEWSGGRFDLGFIVPVALGVGAVGSLLFSRHERIPRWDNLLYWSVHFFRVLNRDRLQAAGAHADGG